jgi:K+-sensing histidine kinase KdpD
MPVEAFVVSLIDRESHQSDVVYRIGDPASAQSLISAPLRRGEETIGMFFAQSYQPQVYLPHHQQLLQIIADHVSIALENAHLFSSLEDRYRSLQEANRLRLEFIQNLSHELRTPLTFLTGYTELLLSGELGRLNIEQMETLSSIQSKTDNLVRLVEDLSGLDSSSTEWLNLRPTSLLQALRNAVSIAETNANQKGVYISLELPANVPPIQADPERLMQAFRDLLDHAIRLSSPNSEIVVVLQDSQDRAVVSIINQGEALTAQRREGLLESIDLAGLQLTDESFGLAIARHIIIAHQGKLWIESAEGLRNAFCFSLPYQPVTAAIREDFA